MPFGKAVAIISEHERDMPPFRRLQVKCFVQQGLPGGTWQQIISANNLRNTLPGIIDDNGQLVRRCMSASPDNEITREFMDIMVAWSLYMVINPGGAGVDHEPEVLSAGVERDA